MKKLTKKEQTELAAHVAALRKTKAQVETTLEDVNTLIAEKLNPAIGKYNALLAAADAWRDEIASAIYAHIGERTDHWHETDIGMAYNEWLSAWQNADLASPVEAIEEITIDATDHTDLIDALPVELSL